MKKHVVIELTLLSALFFGLGRYYESRIRIQEEASSLMSAYRDGKSKCIK